MLRLVLCRSRYFICEGKFNIHKLVLQGIVSSQILLLSRIKDPLLQSCKLSRLGNLQLRYAFNTLASVTPRLIKKSLWLKSLGSLLTSFRSVEFGTMVYISRWQDTIFISYRTMIEEQSSRYGSVHFGVVVVD